MKWLFIKSWLVYGLIIYNKNFPLIKNDFKKLGNGLD